MNSIETGDDKVFEAATVRTLKCGELRMEDIPPQDCLATETIGKSHENRHCSVEKKGHILNGNKNGLQLHDIIGPVENGDIKPVSQTSDQQELSKGSCDENISASTDFESCQYLQNRTDNDVSLCSRTGDNVQVRTENTEANPIKLTTASDSLPVPLSVDVSCTESPSCTDIGGQRISLIDQELSHLSIRPSDSSSELQVSFVGYQSEAQMPEIMALITQDLSEPYSVYTYRYFLHNWPNLSHLAYCDGQCIGAVVCKLDLHRKNVWRGYIAMLVIHKDFRKQKIGSSLVKLAIKKMIEQGCDEVVLETEVTNRAALGLYENLGFVRDKRLLRYYLNGVDAWRLKLWL